MKLKKNFKRKRPLYRILEFFIRKFSKKPRIIDENEGKIDFPCIFVSNHSAASGPMKLVAHSPYKFSPWGTHQMCGSYKQRWNYLYYTFYRTKLKYSKLRSFIIATIFAVISRYLYRNARLIPTFENNMFTTIRMSIKEIQSGRNVLVFPEDSSDGYHQQIKHYFKGFVSFAQLYFKKYNVDLPVVPIYYNKEKAVIHMSKVQYLNKQIEEGKTPQQIADEFKDLNNVMSTKYANE